MKPTYTSLFLATLLGLAPVSLAAASSSKSASEATPARIEVVYDHPEKFTDVKDSQMGSDKGRDAILEELRDFIISTAEGVIPKDAVLTLSFTDIDLAGDFEPWRHSSAQDVRIVKDIYPPRFDFSYKLTDASGKVLKEGKEKLRDLTFMSRLVIDRGDPLRFEKDMLRDWLRSNLRISTK